MGPKLGGITASAHADVQAIIDDLAKMQSGLAIVGLEASILSAATEMLARQSYEIAEHRAALKRETER